MQKRTLLAVVLCLVVILTWQKFVIGDPKPPPKKPDGESATTAVTTPPVVVPVKKTVDPALIKEETLSNAKVRVVFSNVGGTLKSADLLDFHPTASPAHQEIPLRLLAPKPIHSKASGADASNAPSGWLHSLRLDDLGFPESELGESIWEMSKSEDGRALIFKKEVKRGDRGGDVTYLLTKEYRLDPNEERHIRVKISAEFPGERAGKRLTLKLGLLTTAGVFQEIGGEAMSPCRSAVYPFDGEMKLVPLSEVVKSEKEAKDEGGALATLQGKRDSGGFRVSLSGSDRYVADLSNYFGAYFWMKSFPGQVTAIIHSLDYGTAPGREDLGAKNPRTATVLSFEQDVDQGAGPVSLEGLLYLGPVKTEFIEKDLAHEGTTAAEALGGVYRDQLGWASFVGKPVLMMLNLLYSFVGNWGWAIVLLTLCVRLVLFPINRRSQAAMVHHQEAMARIKPKLEELKAKFKEKPKEYAQAQMQLFRAEKVPMFPMGGCLPILLQMPIFFGLFAALRASIDLRQADWLWVRDLSQPDHLITFAKEIWNPLSACSGCCGMPQSGITGLHLLPLLMTGAWFLNSWLMPKPAVKDPQMEQQRKMMLFMPVLFGFMMYGYAAGLSLYWLTSSLLGILESQFIKKVWPVKKRETSVDSTKGLAKGVPVPPSFDRFRKPGSKN